MKLITLHLKLKFSTPKKNVNTPQNICEYQSLVAYNNSTVAALEIFLQIETTLKRILQINYANRKHKSNSYIDGYDHHPPEEKGNVQIQYFLVPFVPWQVAIRFTSPMKMSGLSAEHLILEQQV